MKSVIVNDGGEVRSLEGPSAIDAFRLRILISGLKFEAETGMKMSRGPSCLKLAKQMTGLKTNDRAKLTERLELMMQQRVSECLIVEKGEQS